MSLNFLIIKMIRGGSKIQILGLPCGGLALVGQVWDLESIMLTSLPGDLYEKGFWKSCSKWVRRN